LDDLAPTVRRIGSYRTNTGRTMLDMNAAFLNGNLNRVRHILESILADLPSETYQKQTQGRADAVVETAGDVFLFEFKFNQTAAAALAQLRANGYADKYRAGPRSASGKTLTAIGVNFNAATRTVDDWLTEPF